MSLVNPIEYPYVGGDPVENRHSYTYVPFEGRPYIDAWGSARDAVRARLGAPNDSAPEGRAAGYPETNEVRTADLLDQVFFDLARTPGSEQARRWVRWLIQRFEVSKRVFPEYTVKGHRGKGRGEYRDWALYLRLAEVLAASFASDRSLPGLNALVKCMDTLCSFAAELDAGQQTRLARLIDSEKQFVEDVSCSNALPAPKDAVPDSVAGRVPGEKKHLEDIVLLVADTVRSRGYAQALRANGIRVGAVLMITTPGGFRWGQSNSLPEPPAPAMFPDLFIPDLRIPLAETCSELSDRVETIATGTINADQVVSRLQELKPSLVIYSGFGGEIVSSDVLSAAGPLLHMHAGWLPDYRGSTTVYYSILERNGCGVSAILLTPQIDAGEILCRRWYPAPPAETELDYYLDSIIRSDVMLAVITHFAEAGTLPEGRRQKPDEGEVFYIIHPVLKHLAILRLRSGQA